MRINDTRTLSERGVDAYFTPREAVESLVAIESIPYIVVDPACGDGSILRVLDRRGHKVIGSDIVDYGWPGTEIEDYMASPVRERQAIVTNPPYILAIRFLEKALTEAAYVAFLLRLNFLESVRRYEFFLLNPPTRLWVSSRRLPMMHRFGWTGKETTSNQTFGWFIWDRRTPAVGPQLKWFDWKDASQ